MLWFDSRRIPPGKWPFLSTTYVGLGQLENALPGSVDLTEDNDEITITGRLDAYRYAILRRNTRSHPGRRRILERRSPYWIGRLRPIFA